GGLTREGLEAALCVLVPEAEDQMQSDIESAAQKLTVEGLSLFLQGANQPPGANSDIGTSFDGCKQFLRLINCGRQIGVSEEQDVAAGVEHAIADTVALAPVAGVLHYAQIGGTRLEAIDYLNRVVGRTVIDDDKLRLPSLLRDIGNDLFKRCADALTLIKGRDDYAIDRALHALHKTRSLYAKL